MAKRGNSSTTDPTRKKPLPEIREEFEYYRREWADVRDAAADDMQNVAGNPWTEDDLDVREGRPTVAPDEMTQYRNQVTNALRKSPRGIKFQPRGAGADPKTAEFYQDKAREIEYRSGAIDHYIGAAENVLQRSYGAFRVGIRYENPRDLNPEIYIDGFPDPDVVLPDPAIKRANGQDMKGCFVLETMTRSDFKRRFTGAAVTNFSDFADRYKEWLVSSKLVQVAERWRITTRPRALHAVVLQRADHPDMPPSQPMAFFDDELEEIKNRQNVQILSNRFVRDVEYPKVVRQITNGLEVLESIDWKGRYIPIVMMFGPTLWVPEGGTVKRKVMSMTRYAKEPWKSYCYACSQELEVLGQVPKAAAIAYAGQLAGYEDDWEDSLQRPKAFLYALGRVPGMKEAEERLPLPQRMEYAQAEYLQAIELVKEGFRRAIQAAMGSNFLPTQAQKMNDKSGAALDKIDEAAAAGTYHFVNTYEGGIQFGGLIMEDLMDKVYDQTGDTGVMTGKLEAKSVRINDRESEEAYSTRGDHLVTVSTAPSSDSEYDAVETFIDRMVTNLGAIAQICGPQQAAYILAQSIKMRNLGVLGDELADTLMPESFKTKDGKPPDPRLAGAQQQIQQLQKELQAAQFTIQTKQVEGRIKASIEQMKIQATTADKAADRAVKLDVAAIQAHIETMAMVLEELKRIGGANTDAQARLHDAGQAVLDRHHTSVESAKDRLHERHTQRADHEHAGKLAAVGAMSDSLARQEQGTIDAAHADADAARAQQQTGAGGAQ